MLDTSEERFRALECILILKLSEEFGGDFVVLLTFIEIRKVASLVLPWAIYVYLRSRERWKELDHVLNLLNVDVIPSVCSSDTIE